MKFELSHHKSLSFPFAFEIVDDAEAALVKGLPRWPLFSAPMPKVLFLCGPSGATRRYVERYQAVFESVLGARCMTAVVARASLAQAREIDAACASTGADAIVAVGGGTVIDVAKMVVRLRRTPLMVVPSALSSDGIASPISVLANEDGKRMSLASGIPSCLFVDLDLVREAPRHLTLAGVGDVLSNVSALLDLAEFEHLYEEPVDGFAKVLSKSAFELVMTLKSRDLESLDGYRRLAMGLVLSAMAMSFAGNSLPCSGAEHLISHAMDSHGVGSGVHGHQVALATLYCLALRGKSEDDQLTRVKTLMADLGLPLSPETIGAKATDFLRCVSLGPRTRPDRHTVLSSTALTSNQLCQFYQDAFEVSAPL